MGEVIVITSGKGGVGKTTSTANIGMGFALVGKKVVLIDADIGLRNLDIVMGLENKVVFDLVDVCEGNCRLKQALIKDKKNDMLYLLPAAQTRDNDAITPSQMKQVCQELAIDFEYIIIDCPAGIGKGFKNAIAGASKVIIIVTPEMSSIRDADKIIRMPEINVKNNSRLIINKIRPLMMKKNEMMNIDDMLNILSVDLLGIIPDDDNILAVANRGESVVEDLSSRAGIAYKNIVRRLMGENVPLMMQRSNSSIFHKFKKFFR